MSTTSWYTPKGPWRKCLPCDVMWQGWDNCWTCGSPAEITAAPRVQTYASITEQSLFPPLRPLPVREDIDESS